MNDYYDVCLKEHRVSRIKKLSEKDGVGTLIPLCGTDISDKNEIEGLFLKYRPSIVVNLAAQVGVRYSVEKPYVYISSNK